MNYQSSLKIFAAIFWLLSSVSVWSGCGVVDPKDYSAPPAVNASAEKTNESSARGEQIVTEYLKRDAAPFRKSRLRFTVTSETEPPIVYEVDVWRKQSQNETLTLTHIVKPAADSDLSSLISETGDQDAQVATFIASRDEFRETGTNKSFFGGVPTEELLGEWTKYAYRFIGEKEINNVKVLEVEGKLLPAKNSLAARISALFRADNYLPSEIHLFDSSDKELRSFKITNYKTDGNRTYISATTIENPIYKTKVAVDVLGISFPDKIDDAFFTREQLKRNAQKQSVN